MSRYGLGNFGHYRGDSLSDLFRNAERAAERRFKEMRSNLIDVIGQAAFEAWVDDTLTGEESWAKAKEEIEHELDRYECSCNPIKESCPGCLRRDEVRSQFQHTTEII